MARSSRPTFLRLVHSDISGRASSRSGSDTQAQDSFLPSSRSNTLIFLAWGQNSADDLLDIFELSNPRVIFDMRMAPRFDLGALTRKRFFDLLNSYDCQYIDLLGRMGVSNTKDALLNPSLVASHAAQFTRDLSLPNAGPFVFIHDDDLIDDDYVSALARALPCSSSSGWQLYRPQGRGGHQIDKKTPKDDKLIARDTTAATPIARRTIFISHATPQDNPFVIWLTSKLTLAGYEVWCDVASLAAGDSFWNNIESVIRFSAAKVIFVQSEHVKEKSGTRKEVYLALRVGEKNHLQRFVLPMRIDATPYDETLIELIDLQAIDCRNDWLAGLKSLLTLLQRDNVPRSSSFKTDHFSNLISKFGQPAFRLVQSEELLVSNLLPVVVGPERVNFFSCGGLQSNQLPSLAAELPIPAFAYYTHIATTATCDRFAEALASVGFGDVCVGERASLSWKDFLDAKSGDLPGWTRSEARYKAFKMLHKAWAQSLGSCGTSSGLLANERPFWFFTDQHFEDNKVRFLDYSGRLVRRQLVGFSMKRHVYWHFGVQARCVMPNEQFFFALTPHVTFSSDGKVPLSSKPQLHSLRRSFCRSWWNGRWRDLMQGFVAAIASGDSSLRLDVGSSSPLAIETTFTQFVSPISLVSASSDRSLGGGVKDDEIGDDWEDDFDNDDLTIDESEESGSSEAQ